MPYRSIMSKLTDAKQGRSLENKLERGYGDVVVHRLKDHALIERNDFVASEVPVALVFNGISHAVMLATPLNLVDFALGFSFS